MHYSGDKYKGPRELVGAHAAKTTMLKAVLHDVHIAAAEVWITLNGFPCVTNASCPCYCLRVEFGFGASSRNAA